MTGGERRPRRAGWATPGEPGDAGGNARFLGDGVMASLIARFNWADTPLGPLECWPQSLKTTVAIMLRSAVPMVLLWGSDGVMIFNDAYSEFAGADYPEKLGRDVWRAWPEVTAFNTNVMRVVLAGGTLAYADQELTLVRGGQAQSAFMNLDYSPVIDESGQPAGVIAIVVETTARVLADRRVIEELERQRQLLGRLPGFIAVCRGPEHIYEYVNDAYVDLIGRREMVGRTVREVLPELAGQGIVEMLDEVYRSGVRMTRRGLKFELGDRGAQFVDVTCEPVLDRDGRVTGIFSGGYDVTAPLQAASALRASEERLRQLNADLEREVIKRTQARGTTWQVSPDLLGAINADGFFETANPAWLSVLGWIEEELTRTCIYDLVHPEDVERTREARANLYAGKPSLRFANRCRCKDGSYRWISWVGVVEEGLLYCNGRDISAEKAAEAALLEAQEALRHSQKMEAVGQLTGGIAHDFNNLLTGIGGSLEMLDRRIADGRLAGAARYIDMAQASTRRAAAMTQRLLAFSRRQTLDPRAIDINVQIATLEELVRRTVGPAITVEVIRGADLWPTRVDPSQLENAVLNLTINARDAMPDGGRLVIRTANQELDAAHARELELPEGAYVTVSVADNGTGMSAEVARRAFDPFYTTKPLGQGTGLGLSMIHGFVRQSGGQVKAETALGLGTTMTLYLPRFAGLAELWSASQLDAAPAALEGGTVLVIDDEDAVRTLVADVLEDAGYHVLQASDGPAGLLILQSDAAIDLLLTDVGLPGGLNGRQVADAGRALRPELKILFITGYAENVVTGAGLVGERMTVMTKPFGMSDLAARVREILHADPARRH